ncbi:hypothetical protein LCI18_010246 [Fusarium solani-melongenae]|uniref:Uncharacterized protein n=1 Tax=Fusarium solani subsp. cucurbitae TaxID=2747967 RepID=A0ACD3ZDP4_FUSSC|nr:hypothetical protein LCI18_010246 [Fusarium solani-melongenae]
MTPNFRTPEPPPGDNTLLFGSPRNGLTLADHTNISGTPGVNTLLQPPDFRTPELPPGDNTLLFRSPANGFTPDDNTGVHGSPGVNTLLRTPNITGRGITTTADYTPGLETPKVTGADETLVVSWGDLPATTPAQDAPTDVAPVETPKVTAADGTLVVSWDDLPEATPMAGFLFITQERKQVMDSRDDACRSWLGRIIYC